MLSKTRHTSLHTQLADDLIQLVVKQVRQSEQGPLSRFNFYFSTGLARLHGYLHAFYAIQHMYDQYAQLLTASS